MKRTFYVFVSLLVTGVILVSAPSAGAVGVPQRHAPRAYVHYDFKNLQGEVHFDNMGSYGETCTKFKWYVGSTYKGKICVNARQVAVRKFAIRPNALVKVQLATSTRSNPTFITYTVSKTTCGVVGKPSPCGALSVTRNGVVRYWYNTLQSPWETKFRVWSYVRDRKVTRHSATVDTGLVKTDQVPYRFDRYSKVYLSYGSGSLYVNIP